MKTALNLLSLLFRNVVLKPLDFLLFNGSGVLYLSRDELRDAMMRNGRSAQAAADDEADSMMHANKGFTNFGLPDVRYGGWGEEFNMPPGGWADRG